MALSKSVIWINSLSLMLSCVSIQPETYRYREVDYLLFKTIPNQIDSLPPFALDLSGKNLETIPTNYKSIKSLNVLNIGNNQIKNIGVEICNASSLKVLILNNNPIHELPECLTTLEQLEVISIIGTQVNELPSTINKLSRLRILAIGGNPIPKEQILSIRKSLPNCRIIQSVD
ncbi:MAG: leucine-rich repeat domain-containing protein [Cyclobacteriaceae bacterium]|nr:leucine-rich repeat domain-containing protein [Cyclobacteriaceae bacterium]